MKKIALLLAIFAIGLQSVLAQTKEITGTVTSADDGSTIPGVSVSVKGTTLGTITDLDGNYSMKVPQDAKTLVFSFVGMQTLEVVIEGATVNAALQSDVVGINEVVVTALGISRERKSLGYAVQEVSGEEVNNTKGDNFVTSLSGRVSGIQVKNNTNFGGSTNVIIRGSSSLTGNNQALFIVDGIPIDNANTNNSGQTTGRSGYDYGNAAADINPNDIESISVLKGAAATALYGSRAANGVILITTKKGKDSAGKGPQVKVSSNVTISKIDKKTFPEYQTSYGAGYGDYYYSDGDHPGLEYYADVNGDGVTDYTTPYYEDASRGEKFDASLMVYQWDALYADSPNYLKATPWVAGANGPESFFETGVSTSNSVDVSGGDDQTTYRFNYTYFDQSGVMPNSHLDKHNLMFNGSHKILDNLKITSSANYIRTSGKGRPSTGYSDNIMSSFRQWYQVNVDLGLQEQMYKKTHQNITWNPVAYDDLAPAYWDNPYWVRYENYETDGRSRLIGYAQLDWDITSDLSAMGRYSIDTYEELQEERKAVGSGAGEFGVDRPDVTSGYSRYTKAFTETNLDLMLNYHKSFTEDLDFTAILGMNVRRTKNETVYASTNNGLAVEGLYALSNSVDAMLPPEEVFYRVGVNGIFGSVSLGYKNTLFLDGTLRRDQSSTLPEANNTYYYPSVTTSFIFSNLAEADWMSLGKVRLNYAEVGNSAPALSTKDVYSANSPFSGTSLVTLPNTKKNSTLKPERTKSWEAGLEMNFVKNRVGFDLAFYKTNTTDQLMPVTVSYATGFSSNWVNAGELQNKGIELAIMGTPVKSKDFRWDARLNWSTNKNEVISLYKDESGNQITNLQLASFQGGVSTNARVGQPYGTILGSDFQYADNGGKIVSQTTGRYLKTSTNDQVIGDTNPDWNAGLSNSFKYKNLALSFLIDWQKGGDVFSLDLWYGMGTGLYKETAGLNDLGNEKRSAIEKNSDGTYASTSGGTINPGVDADGNPNTVRVSNQNYGADGWAVSPNKKFVYDASYIKLREVTLTYDLPKSIVNKLYLENASIGIVASNLWIIHKNLPYADPEASQGSGNYQGWQSGVMPANKNFGFTLNLQF
ncbi:SusC/RagA family TonB-linked outer membrane protein [Mangrovibacterium diazotrophicum]|uniref:TonB-linked SusC/RagA family outer membrane protein n=1 Tax=Mangrovibacterium diazotrophicum TaxID=1261403 RepID=A0A419WBD0_9BACT|nr:SusC/RagA family TonB-linked outer membrane protein [Mangrovibacterium diazotrophicum]RKD92791.1 TonB-linked SusC/RagA family outer membrane protein [Mangrovibacterium diazotrophicum]